MEPQYLTINKKDNKLLYFLDTGLDKFVVLMITIARFFVPGKFKKKFDKLTEHKDMLHNVVGLSFFNVLGGLCVMATQVKLANYLGASIYGIYSYCLAIGEVGAMVVRYGRNKTMVRDLIQNPEKRDSIIVSTFVLSLINLILFFAVIIIFHNPLDVKLNIAYFLLILSPCLISFDPGSVYASIKMMSWHSIYALLQKFSFLIIIWGLFWAGFNIGLLTLGVFATATWLIVIGIQYKEIITQLRISVKQAINKKDLLFLYKDNFPIFLSCACGVAFGPLMRLILNNYADSAAVGVYAAGLQIFHICFFFNTQVAHVGGPMMAEAGKSGIAIKKKKRLVRNYLIIMILIAIPFILPMTLIPGLIVNAMFTDEYSSLTSYLPILAGLLLCTSIGSVFEQFLLSSRKNTTYFSIYVTSAILTLVSAYLLIPPYGTLGAILALCVPRSLGYLTYGIFSIPLLKNK